MSLYDDAIIECFEIFIQTVLYMRKLYPQEIFRRRKIYSIPVFVSIYPQLNDYLKNVLKSAKYLVSNRKLQQLEIVFYRDQDKQEQIFESYCFEVDSLQEKLNQDVYLFDFEDSLKRALLQIEDKTKGLSRLVSNAKFKILLHTTRSAYMSLSENSELCDFIWFRDDSVEHGTQSPNFEDKREILPLTGIADVGLQIYMKRNISFD